MNISCPFCGYTGRISEKLVPEEGRNIGCPTCKKRFIVRKTSDPQIGMSTPVEEGRPQPEPEMVIERNVVPGFQDRPPQPASTYRAGLPPAQTGEASRLVPTYLAQAILVTLFCCLPFGIVAIVYASQVNSKLLIGDYSGARQSSASAKTWCWVSFGLGLVFTLLYFLILGVAAVRS